MKLVLESVERETDQISVFRFAAADGSVLPAYEPGAHVDFDLGPVGTRSYSLIDWPHATGTLDFAIQREDEGQGGSRAMHGLAAGQTVTANGPRNDFPLAENSGSSLLVAGGIGITPLISMATRLHASGRAFELHYAARTASRMGFAERLTTAFGRLSNSILTTWSRSIFPR